MVSHVKKSCGVYVQVAICEGLEQSCSLTTVDMSCNSWCEESARLLGSFLASSTALVSLNLGACKIGRAGCKAIFEGLGKNSSLCRLDVSFDCIGVPGGQLPGYSWPAGPIFESGIMSSVVWSRPASSEGSRACTPSSSYRAQTPSTTCSRAYTPVRDLRATHALQHPVGETSAQASWLGSALTLNSSLHTLRLHGKGTASWKALSEGVRRACLTELSVSNNDVALDGLRVLGLALEACKSLRTLALVSCKVGPTGCAALACGISANSSLTLLDLSSNRVGASGKITHTYARAHTKRHKMHRRRHTDTDCGGVG